MMNPAEEITKYWLQQEGFFTMDNVSVGFQRKEIDILAFHPLTGEHLHVEVKVSVRPAQPIRGWGPSSFGSEPLKDRVRDYCNNKFVGIVNKKTRKVSEQRRIERKAESLLGTREYKKMLVLGKLKGDSPDEITDAFAANEVEVVFFERVICELHDAMVDVQQNGARKYVQLIKKFQSS